jgi:predicted MPP superfamily phosphohydrolase
VSVKKKIASPLRILHLSDIHFRDEGGALGVFFEELGRDVFDFIFITGDIFDCPAGAAGAALFRKLKSRNGIFAVFGNHDYFNYGFFDLTLHFTPGQGKPHKTQPVERLEKALGEAGVRLLRNETVEVISGATPILIHGLDDPITGRANVRQAMQNFDPSKLNILLTHSIDVFMDIGENEVDLSFSGHSHGGQVCFPVIGPVVTHTILGRQYAKGIHTLKGAICSISRGLGTSRFFQIRLLCAPEAIALTVSSKAPKR